MKAQYDVDWLIKKYMTWLSQFGMDEENVRTHFEEWKKESQSESMVDYLLYILYVLLGETSKQIKDQVQFFQNSRDIYCKMFEVRRRIKGEKANDIIQFIGDCDIQLAFLSPFEVRLKYSAGHCCPHCDGMNNQLFTADDAMRNQYLASNQCTREWGCNCRYVAVTVRDEEDRLLMKNQ